MRETVAEILGDAGYLAVSFAGAREALDSLRARRHRPSLILLDLMMPGMSGWQFRDEQLRDPLISGIPVVVMTASKDLDRNPIEAREVLHKPMDLHVLLAAVARHAAPP